MTKHLTLGKKNIFNFLFSLTIAFITYFYYPEWYISIGIFSDDHYYWGAGEVYEYLNKYFSDTYYFHRWTVNFPHLIFQTLFGGFWGLLIYKNLLLIFSIFFILRIFESINCSIFLKYILIIILVFNYGFFIRTIGNSYLSSENFFLIILTIAFLNSKYKNFFFKEINYKYTFIFGILLGLLFINYPINLRIITCLVFLFFFENIIKIIKFNKKLILNFLFVLFGFLFVIIILDSFFAILSKKNLIYWFLKYKYYFNLYDEVLLNEYNLNYKNFLIKTQYFLSFLNVTFSILYLRTLDKLDQNIFKYILKFNIIYFTTVLLEPFHGIGSSFKYNYAYIFLFLCFLNSSIILMNILKKFKESKNFTSLLFLLVIFLNFYLISSIETSPKLKDHYSKQVNKIPQKEKIEILSQEVREAAFASKILDKKLVIVDFRKYYRKSPTIMTFYGNYSSLANPLTMKVKECEQLNWNIPNKDKTMIVAYHHKNETNIKQRVLSLISHCKNYDIYKFNKVKIINASIFLFNF